MCVREGIGTVQRCSAKTRSNPTIGGQNFWDGVRPEISGPAFLFFMWKVVSKMLQFFVFLSALHKLWQVSNLMSKC